MQTALADPLADCRTCASTLIVIGLGVGGLIERIASDRMLNTKDVRILSLPGETAPTGELPKNIIITIVNDYVGVQQWIWDSFGAHESIIKLAGADIVDTHELCPQAEAFRAEHLPRIRNALADRPWALGNDINDTFMGLHHAALNARTILPCPSIGNVSGVFGPTPAIAIGAGPSVGEHLDALRALQTKCILVACDAVYPGLIAAGIVPHFVTPLERLKQQAQFVACAKGTRTIFAGIPACHPSVVEPFDGKCIYMHAMDRLYNWLAPAEELVCTTGSSTGVLSFLVAASLTRGPVYLVGHDLAKGANGTHWQACDFAAKAHEHETNNVGSFGANGYETRFVPGNDGTLVESCMWWDTFRFEISSQAKLIRDRVFNVNAHTKRYAVIEHTQSGPLPDPASLNDLPEIRLERGHAVRYDSWKARAAQLPADCEHFKRHMGELRTDLRAMWAQAPHAWNLDTLLSRMLPDAGVSPGNQAAFQYFLRSAVYNEQMYMHARSRTYQVKEQAYWHTMLSLDGLAATMTSAIDHLQPVLEAIARDC
jgi:hypothetical protein